MSLIFKKIPLIMNDVGSITKERENKLQGYSFRGVDDVMYAFQPILVKHGVFCSPEVLNKFREERQSKSGGTLIYTVLDMKFTFYAEDGSHISAITIGEAMDSGDKSANKAMSTAFKYAFFQVFCVPTKEDNDTENHSPEPALKKPLFEGHSPGTTHWIAPPKSPPEPFNKMAIPLPIPIPVGDWLVPFGKYKDRLFNGIPEKDRNNYAAYLESEAHKKDRPLTGVVLEFITRCQNAPKQVDTFEQQEINY